ncbi:MAG: tetratricopeptide repeat protein [Muribaculaceae bacterium]|nr:tetratricopeptide repeat protein [Muribaculaceae bacterium]
MRTITFLGLCVAASVAANAQTGVVKEAEQQAKNGKYLEAIATIQPALTNPETSQVVTTWFIPGKAGLDYYKEQYLNKTIGKNVDGAKMGHALIDGYNYLLTALPLDSVPDAKGKVKPKYSKEIVKLIKENYDHFNNAAVFLWDAQDYKGAYDAWDIVINAPSNPVLGMNAPKAYPDSTLGDIIFNQGLAAWQMDSIKMSLASFEKAMAIGYDKSQIYDYAISHAARLGDNDKVYALAEEAFQKFGNANPLYLQLMINGRIEKEQYEEAAKMLDDAIAVSPNDAQLYNIKGVLYESMKDNDKARELYLQAVQIDPTSAQAQYNYGRQLCTEAYSINDKAQESNIPNAEYQKLREEKLNPLFRQAAEHLEAALKADPENHDVKTYLRNVYYNLGDDENLKRIENM